MSGHNIPYQLRPNKHVERMLFIDLLGKLVGWKSLDQYCYISMAGLHFEDAKLVHGLLGIKNIISFESDVTTFRRQEFNKPIGLIKCINRNSADFVTNFESIAVDAQIGEDTNYIVWLDFADTRRISQLNQLGDLVSKLGPNDIIKITMNANAESIFGNIDAQDPDYLKLINDAVKKKLGDYAPPSPISKYHTGDIGLCEILCKCITDAAKKGMKNKFRHELLPLAVFRYNDARHTMLTFTAIIIANSSKSDFLTKTNIEDWEFHYKAPSIPEISIPNLSLKEKIYIDHLMFSGSEKHIHDELPFKLDSDDNESLKILQSYLSHYKRVPQYVRVLY